MVKNFLPQRLFFSKCISFGLALLGSHVIEIKCFPAQPYDPDLNRSFSIEAVVPDLVYSSGRLVDQSITYWSGYGPSSGQALFWGTPIVSSMAIVDGKLTQVTPASSTYAFSPAPTDGLPLNDQPVALTYDSANRRALLATLGGEGFIYERRPLSNWTLLGSLKNERIANIDWFHRGNVFYALRIYSGAPAANAVLLKFNAAGEKIDEIPLPPFPVNIGPEGYASKLIDLTDRLALLVERRTSGEFEAGDRSRIYIINPDTPAVRLTYDRPSPLAPTLAFSGPPENASVRYNEDVVFKASASDLNLNMSWVKLFDNGVLIRAVEFSSEQSLTNLCIFHYQFTLPGPHTVTVSATDFSHRRAEANLHFNVLPPVSLAAEVREDRKVHVRLHTAIGDRYVLESTASLLSDSLWEPLTEIEGSGDPLELPPVDALLTGQFLRLRLIPPASGANSR